MSKQKKCTKLIDLENKAVTFEFFNNEAIIVALSKLPKEIVTHLALHGLSQKLGDSYASSENVDAAFAMFKASLARLVEGEWKQARESTGGPRVTQLVEALARVSGKTLDECATVIVSKSDDEKKQLRNHKLIASAICAIQAERARAKADLLSSKAEGEEDLSALF